MRNLSMSFRNQCRLMRPPLGAFFFWFLLAGVITFAGPIAWAQDGRSTTNEAEAMMKNVPTEQTDAAPGLRPFRINRFDAGFFALAALGVVGAFGLIAPGLALFYHGLSGAVAERRVLLIRAVPIAAILSIQWMFWSYSLAYTRHEHSFDIDRREFMIEDQTRVYGSQYLGGAKHTAMRDFDSRMQGDLPAYLLRRVDDKIPLILFVAFEMALFLTAMIPWSALWPKDWSTKSLLIFCIVWGTIVYTPIAYWVWGGGWQSAAYDSAGGIVVHLPIGCAAIVLSWMARSRSKEINEPTTAPNVIALGIATVMLWIGAMLVSISHFADGGGSNANAFLVTHLAACTGLIGWSGIEWLKSGTPSLAGACCGVVAGLCCIAPGCAVVAPQSALIIGLLGGCIAQTAYSALKVQTRNLAAPFAVQGVSAGLGAVLAGVFATSGVAGFNRHGDEVGGLLTGNIDQLIVQVIAVAVVVVWALLGSFLSLFLATRATR